MENFNDILKRNQAPIEIDFSDVAGKFSTGFFNKLMEHGLIRIDEANRVYLTERGLVARKMGIEKYIQTEKFEIELTEEFSNESRGINFILLVILGALLIGMAVLLLALSEI